MHVVLLVLGIIVDNAPNLVGFILPPFVEVLNKDVQNEKQKQLISIILCFIVAMLLDWNQIANGQPQDAALLAGIIFMESNTLFKLYFKNSVLRSVIQQKLNRGEESETEGAAQ